jgi:hypothetical protein
MTGLLTQASIWAWVVLVLLVTGGVEAEGC